MPTPTMRSVLSLSTLSLLVIAALAFAIRSSNVCAQQIHLNSGSLVVQLKTSNGQAAGTASFKEPKGGRELSITLKLKNLPAGPHAVHIHQNPVCDAPDFKGAGGHLNPDHKQHGTMNPMGHHAGDLPQNISIGEDHTGEAHFDVDYLTLTPGAPNSILGTSIMVHEKADDTMTDPAGNAGNRIACGVIPAPAP